MLTLRRLRRRLRRSTPAPANRDAAGSLHERPDLRIGNLLDDPRLRLAVFGDPVPVDRRHVDDTAA